ncbi:hypothetical protein ACEXOS_018020 [Herbiconiux sp. P16]|uniref:hypothetical protein n=1 Tax=Herbiconiux wuyangfengii TaxID=3342794 RepID=UPI0035B8F43D
MIPSRWPRSLVWLLAVPGGALVGVLLSLLPKFHGLGAGPSVAIGAGVGLLVAVLVPAMKWRLDVRYDRVIARHPGAVVIDAGKSKESMAALRSVTELPPATPDSALSIAVAHDGVHVYSGSAASGPLASIEWSHIVGFGEGFAATGSQTRPAVLLEVGTAGGVVSVPLVVVTEWYLFANARRVSRLREELEGLRGTGAATGTATSAATTGYTTPTRRELLGGPTSRTWAVVSRALGILGTVVVVGTVVLTVALSGGSMRSISIIPLAAVFMVSLLLSVGALFLSVRAERRESAAGYTLARLGDVSVDQVDPKTGFVLRRAGERQLTKQQETAERQRTRALALR